MTKQLEGILQFGADHFPSLADQVMLRREADKSCDKINAMGKGELPYSEEAWNAELERLAFIMRAMDREPETGAAN